MSNLFFNFNFFAIVSKKNPHALKTRGLKFVLLFIFLTFSGNSNGQTTQTVILKVGNKKDARAYYFEGKGLVIRVLDPVKLEYHYKFYDDNFQFQKSLRTKAYRGRFKYYHDEPSQLKMFNKNHPDFTTTVQTENHVVQCTFDREGKVQFTTVGVESQIAKTFNYEILKGFTEVELKVFGDILVSFIKYPGHAEIVSLSCKDGVVAKSVASRMSTSRKFVIDTKTGQYEIKKIEGNPGYIYSNCFVELNDNELQISSGLFNTSGYFIAAERNGKQEFIKHYELKEQPEYSKYLMDYHKTTWATEKKNIQRDIIFNATHSLEESNGHFFQIIECVAESKIHFDPGTGQIEKSYFSGSDGNGAYVQGAENIFVNGNKVFRSLFAGYDHLFFCLNKYDSVGAIVWEKCFAFELNANPYNQYKLVNSEIDDKKQHIKLTYLTKYYVNHVVFDFDGNMVSEKKSEKLLIYFDKNYCASENLNFRFWNSEYYVTSEIQDRYTNTKETREAEFLVVKKVKY